MPDANTWADYWARERERNRQGGRMRRAATDPAWTWLTLDVRRVLDANLGVDAESIVSQPDAVRRAARDGFEAFLTDAPDLADPTPDIEALPLNFDGLGSVARSRDLTLGAPVASAGALAAITTSDALDDLSVAPRATRLTVRCPAGHETTVSQPLVRHRSLDFCGDEECTNEAFVVDEETCPRPTLSFAIEHGGASVRCVAVGRCAHDPDRLRSERVRLWVVPRRHTSAEGTVSAVLEVVAAEVLR